MVNTLKHRMEKKKMEKIERKEERKMKDYRLVVNGWFSYKNDLPQYPAKVYEVREKAINCLFFKKAEKEGEKDKPLYKWVPVSQLVVRGEYTILEALVNDVFNHYKKCEIKNDFANDNKIDISINDFAIEKVSEKALYLVKDSVYEICDSVLENGHKCHGYNDNEKYGNKICLALFIFHKVGCIFPECKCCTCCSFCCSVHCLFNKIFHNIISPLISNIFIALHIRSLRSLRAYRLILLVFNIFLKAC